VRHGFRGTPPNRPWASCLASCELRHSRLEVARRQVGVTQRHLEVGVPE
jgi:hypothetical protein